MAKPRNRLRTVIALGAFLLAAMQAGQSHAKTPVAWVEFVGPGRQASIRVVVSENESCPTLMADGEPLAMRVRAEPGRFLRDARTPPKSDAAFPVRVCEVAAPEGKQRVLFGEQQLPLPAADIRRIVVFGDTGCRIKANKKPQDCASAEQWPYAKVAERAAKARPDLVIHVGDYLYRESCDAVCGPDVGYGWQPWDADFFTPSAPLFAAAPWIMVRGNHEDCSRAADGWFRFLAPGEPGTSCADMSPFFLVDVGGLSFVVMDSSAVADEAKKNASASATPGDDEDEDEEGGSAPAEGLRETIRSGYEKVAQSIVGPAWLLTHSPFYAVRRDKDTGRDTIDNSIEIDAIGRNFSPNIAMIVSGHIHMFEALSFAPAAGQSAPQWPPQLVVGTGGDKLAKKPDKPDQLFDRQVAHALIVKNFAYMILDRDGAAWKGRLFDQDDVLLARCELANRELICGKEH